MKFVVMAGGQGTKLWPMSRETLPKQFQAIVGDKSLIQLNVESLLTKYTPSDIFVSTNEEYVKFVKEQLPQISDENIIVEPFLKKDTGPASGYAMMKVAHKYQNEVVMFYVQPVCIREPKEKYVQMCEGIEEAVKREKKLISGGNRPMYVDVGSDYLRLGKNIEAMNNLEIFQVEEFIDKTGDYNKTKELIENFKVSTHCNHYTTYPEILFEAFKKYKPDWYEVLMEIKEVIGTENEYEKVKKIYEKFTPGRIEELTKQLFNDGKGMIVILPFKWTHITTWNDIYEYAVDEKDEVYQDGNIIDIGSSNVLVKGPKDKLIATIGLHNLIVVDTGDALLICDKDKTAEVKNLIEDMKNKGLDKYL